MYGAIKLQAEKILKIADAGWPCEEHDTLDYVNDCAVCMAHKLKIDKIFKK